MYLIFMRHGEAVAQTDEIANRERKLTPKGKKDVRKVSRLLSRFLKEKSLHVYFSPFVRTRQTARILAEECFAEGFHMTEELLQGDFSVVANHIMADASPVVLVSHHPFLQSYLLETAGAAIEFETASIAVVDYDFQWRKGKLLAYFTPELKRIGKDEE